MNSKIWCHAAWLCFAALLLPSVGAAQEEADDPVGPVEQVHLRGESRGSGGSYSTSVPLDLPAELGGLPVPVSLVHGGTKMGAAGRGWEVPISSIRENRSLAYRRPVQNGFGGAPRVPLQVELTLMGGTMKMVPEGTGYVPQRGNLALRAEKSGDTWYAYDGEGRTYTFTRPMKDGEPLLADTWLLTKIEGLRSGSRVDLDYDVEPRVFTSPDSSGVSVDLLRVKYNYSSDDVAKHIIALNYGGLQSAPLSMTVGGSSAVAPGTVMMRVRTLSSIEVLSREELDDTDDLLKTLRTYNLAYEEDPDTGLPRLESVTVSGQEGTAEANEQLPIASYEYGRVTWPGTPITSNGVTGPAVELRYQSTATAITRPATPVTAISNAVDNEMTLALRDVTGDGLADIVYSASDGTWKVAKQVPGSGSNGTPGFSAATTLGSGLTDAQFTPGVQTRKPVCPPPSTSCPPSEQVTYIDTWRDLIDLNGDGRLDYIVANAEERKWVVYVNKPDSIDPTRIVWTYQEHDVSHLIDHLAGNPLEGAWADGQTHLPLRREASAREIDYRHCELYFDGEWIATNGCGADFDNIFLGTRTSTVWELKDVNGDTAVDFVMSTEPVQTKVYPVRYKYTNSTERIGTTPRRVDSRPSETTSSYIAVVYARNTVGLVPSTAPEHINKPVYSGVSSWIANGSSSVSYSYFDYGLIDVNGDGLQDFVEGGTAWLGDGHYLATASIRLDGEALGGRMSMWSKCEQATSRSTTIERQLSDVTGDGIPDFVHPDGAIDTKRVFIGTGTGFRPAVWARNMGVLSGASSSCDESDPYTRSLQGLLDVDRDGRLETVKTNVDDNTFEVRYLEGSSGARALSAGLLTAVENGHGERTEITYASAKDDNTTLHQTPSPEIVVGKVKTVRSGDTVTETTYAYGNPLYSFDPLENKFRSFGYGRTVAVTATDSATRTPGIGKARATITDRASFVLDPRSESLRMLSVLRGGRVNTVTELAGTLNTADQLLTVNVATDSRRISATTFGAQARYTTTGSADAVCVFVDNPYVGLATEGLFSYIDTCKARGFAYTETKYGWRGTDSAENNVRSGSKVIAIDDYGRVTKRHVENDTRTGTDNACVTTAYATSSTVVPRVLSAVSSVTVGTSPSASPCVDSSARSVVSYEYDGLPQGQVSNGRRTGQEAERRNTLTGALLDDEAVRVFDATYDTRGRLTTLTTTDGNRTRQVSMTVSDPFDLVLTRTDTTATGATNQVQQVTIDPVTMLPLSVTDANGLESITRYDGFGRKVMSLMKLPGETETEGALSYTEYLGFEGGDELGRRVVEKSFANPVDPDTVDTAVGTTVTTSLDEAGRVTTRIAALGDDYTDDLVLSAIVYDELGRIAFEADPFPDSQEATTAYGTTHFYYTDGTPRCSVRGHGPQNFDVAEVVDHDLERYPTCYRHWFDAGQEWVAVKKADAHDFDEGEGRYAPQVDVEYLAQLSAIGQVMERQTLKSGEMQERSTFSYDLLGNMRTHNRAKLEENDAWVESSFVHDSFGQLLSVTEDATLTRSNDYSGWGELIEVSTPADATSGLPARSQLMEYDGLGRLIQRHETNDDVIDTATVNTYTYDTGESIHTGQLATYTLGRLASATSPTSEVYFGYDALGRMIAKATRDPEGEIYVETMSQDADGALTELGMRLPDASHELEKVTYTYDSARRLTGATHAEGTTQTTLYSALGIDPWGRVTSANVGVAGFAAVYANTGRRLPVSFAVASPNSDARTIAYKSYDAIGRELSREEQTNGATAITYSSEYDALGRLSTAEVSTGKSQTFGYDSLGNLLSIDSDNNANDRYMSYRSDNRDRLCIISGEPVSDTDPCNVVHDALGNIVEQPTATSQRTLSFYGSGAVKQVSEAGATADFRYDAFGAVQELDITAGGADTRRDRRYGLVEKRNTSQGTILSRTFPIGGMTASLRGHGSDWVFAIGEARGNRFFVDEQGNFVQDTTYDGLGRPSPMGVTPNDKNYSREQWNGGDFLATFSLSHLGARLYDPVIGRFLSADPLMLTRTAGNSNPYAFAYNDPINFGDPSGMDPDLSISDSYGGGGGSYGGTYNDALGDFYEQNYGAGWTGGVYDPNRLSPLEIAKLRAEFERRNGPQQFGGCTDEYGCGPVTTDAKPQPSREAGVQGGSWAVNPEIARAADNFTQAIADTAGHDVTDIGEWSFEKLANKIEAMKPASGPIQVRPPKGRPSNPMHRPGVYRNPVAEHASAVKTVKVFGKFIGAVGLVGDGADVLNGTGTLVRNPTIENAGKLSESVINIYLMGQGPVGWAAKWFYKPLAQEAIKYPAVDGRPANFSGREFTGPF